MGSAVAPARARFFAPGVVAKVQPDSIAYSVCYQALVSPDVVESDRMIPFDAGNQHHVDAERVRTVERYRKSSVSDLSAIWRRLASLDEWPSNGVRLVDATLGGYRASVLVLDGDFMILSSVEAPTIIRRIRRAMRQAVTGTSQPLQPLDTVALTGPSKALGGPVRHASEFHSLATTTTAGIRSGRLLNHSEAVGCRSLRRLKLESDISHCLYLPAASTRADRIDPSYGRDGGTSGSLFHLFTYVPGSEFRNSHSRSGPSCARCGPTRR